MSKLETYKCSGCGFETHDKKAHCPHCNVIVSTGEKYTPPKVEKICEHCGQSILPKEDDQVKPRPRKEVEESSDKLDGREMQQETDDVTEQGKRAATPVFKAEE